MSPDSVTLRQPSQITLGAGCAQPALITFVRANRIARVFLLTSPSVLASANTLAEALRAESVTVEIAMGVPPEPTTACAEKMRASARSFSPDLVLAVGGGSVLDVAKLVAAIHDRPEPITSFYGINILEGRRTALVCVPTTAGTGSEVSPNALLLDEVVVAKKAVISPALVPDAAVIDPTLMLSLPPALTATTGIDALTHCLETYANLVAHPVVDLRSLEGVRLIGANLARAVREGTDLGARSAVALGSLYGGLGLGPVNTAGVHALAYPLGGEFHLAHGLSIALLLPHVVRFNLPAMPDRHAALADALGTASVETLPDRLEQLIADCGIKAGLSAYGIPRDALPRIVDAGLGVTRLLKNNPREITRSDALRIYEAAF
jgi:alcohol dehydrogenase class IV